jgi:hypothetical protein
LHFSVLVVTDEKPNPKSIEEALRPFRQEPADVFLQDVDVTENARERFLAASGTMLEAPDGSLHDAFDERFYREPTLEEDRVIMANASMNGARDGVRYEIKAWADGFLAAKVRFVPDGWREVPNPNGHNQTLAEFASQYHAVDTVVSEEEIDRIFDHRNGFVLVDDNGIVRKVVVRYNPNAHYDYYVQGGRFSGVLDHLGGADACQRRSLKLEDAVKDFGQRRRKWADDLVAKLQVSGYFDLEGLIRDLHEAKETWRNERMSKLSLHDFLNERYYPALIELDEAVKDDVPDLASVDSLEKWFDSALPLSAYAIVKDGTWHEREKTAWWRDISGDDARWAPIAWKLVSELPEDKWLTVVDCHN